MAVIALYLISPGGGTNGVGSFNLPSDWSSSGTVICIGGGGGGATGSSTASTSGAGAASGGGGGSWAEVTGLGTPGQTVYFQIANGGGAGGGGGTTWFSFSTNAQPASSATGAVAPGGSGGTTGTSGGGNRGSGGIGTTTYLGGFGSGSFSGATVNGGGGGGAGGRSSGGVASTPGFANQNTNSVVGGASGSGVTQTNSAGGVNGSIGTSDARNYQVTNTISFISQTNVLSVSTGTFIGPATGANGGQPATSNGGFGLYGGGGGGGGHSTGGGTAGGRGGDGLIILVYTPSTPPTVSAISPNSGTTFGGTSVTITGTNFNIGTASVTIGGNAATSVVVVSATSITCVTPSQYNAGTPPPGTGTNGAQSVLVTTTGAGGTNAANSLFTYTTAAPTITTTAGSIGGVLTGGNTVTITGTNFTQVSFSVTFNGNAATSVTPNSAGTSLTCIVPTSAVSGLVNVVVTNSAGSATLTSGYRYLTANRYWVGGTGTWDATITHWADSTGGTVYSFMTVPSSTTDVYFDSSSGSPTVTISTATCKTLTISGTVTFAGSASVNIFGGLAISGAGFSIGAYTGTFVFSAASSSYTFASTASLYALQFNCAGGTYTQSGTITCNNIITITASTLVAFNNTVTCQRYVVTGSTSRTVTYTSATFYLTGNGATIVDGTTLTLYSGSTGLTANTFNANYSGSTGTRTFVWTINAPGLPLNITAGADIVTFTASSYLNSLNLTGFTGSWASTAINMLGSLTTPVGMTTTGTALLTFNHTSGTATITSGITYTFPITQNSPGGTVALGSNVTLPATQTYTLTAGTLNLSTFVLSTGIFSSSNANTRAITFSGGGYIACSHIGSGTNGTGGTNLIDMATLTGMTYNGSSRFDFTAAASGTSVRQIGDSSGYGSTGGSTSLLLNVNVTAGSNYVYPYVTNYFGSLIFQSGFSGYCNIINGTIVFYGSLTTSAAMYDLLGTSTAQWSHTSGTVNWTSNGKNWGFPVTISGTGGTVQLVDNINLVSRDNYYISTNGTTQYITGPCGFYTIGTGDYTIEFWWSVPSADQNIFHIYSATTTKRLYFVYTSSTGVINVQSDIFQVTSTAGALTSYVGRFVHIAYVRSSGSTKLYINGTQTGSTYTPDNYNYDTATDFYVGRAGPTGTFYSVLMSNLRIANVAVYTGNFTPEPTRILNRFQSAKTNTKALYGTETLFLTFQNYSFSSPNYTIYDNSINNYTITNISNATQNDATANNLFTLTAGTLNLNDNILTLSGLFSSNNSSTRSISTGTKGGGYIRLVYGKAGTIWEMSTLTGFTTSGLYNLSVYLDLATVNAAETKVINHGTTAGATSSNAINMFPYMGYGSTGFGYTFSGSYNDLAFNWAPLYSMSFNGSTQYISTASNAVFTCAGDFTVEGWYYPTTVSGSDHAIFCLGTETTNRYVWYITSAGQIASNLFGGSTVTYTVTTITVNTWNHIAVVRSGSTVKVFLNGIESITTDTQAGTIGNGVVNIGADSGGTAKFVGYISNFRVVKGIAVYIQTTEPTTSLTTTSQGTSASQVKLLTAQSATIIDNSSYPNTINNIGTVTAGNTTIPFAGTYSYQFNGTSQYLTFAGSRNFQFNGDFTIEFYLRVNSIATTQSIIDGYKATTTASGNWKIYVDTAGKINVNYDGSSSFITTSAVISINTWYHIALHRFSNTFSLYIAGVRQALTGTTTFSSTFGYIPNNSNDEIWIGAQQLSGPTAYLNGYISNLKIVNGFAAYVTNFTPPLTTLQANQTASGNNIAAISDPVSTSLIACHLPVFKDGSVNNIALTNNGTATIVSGSVPKFINSSSDETAVGFLGSLTSSASARTLYGSLTLTTAMNVVTANAMNFSGSNLQLLSSYNNRNSTAMNWTINTGASVKLNHNLIYTSLACYLNYGTLDLNNLTLSCTQFSCTGLFARTLVTGTSGRIITSIFTGSTGTTISGSGTIDVTTTFTGAALSYPIIRAIGNLTITDANTITTLTNYPTTGIPTLTLPSSTTQTVTSLNLRGNPNRLLYIRSSISGTAATISDTAGTNNLYYVDVKDITVSGGATFNRDTNTTVANTNITGFTATSLNPTTASTGNFISFFYGS